MANQTKIHSSKIAIDRNVKNCYIRRNEMKRRNFLVALPMALVGGVATLSSDSDKLDLNVCMGTNIRSKCRYFGNDDEKYRCLKLSQYRQDIDEEVAHYF